MKMFLKVNNTYVLNFEIDNSNLTYTGKIIEVDNNFVTFIDKFGDTITYALSTLKSSKEIQWET